MLHSFKSYSDFVKLMDFAYWWSFIGKGLHLQPAQQACLLCINTILKVVGKGKKMDTAALLVTDHV